MRLAVYDIIKNFVERRQIVTLILAFIAFGYKAEAQRNVIFVIHGVLGSPADFGKLPEVLEAHLKLRGKPSEIVTYSYDTRSKERTVQDFSIELAHFIDNYFAGTIEPEDKISFVMHSQGGLIGLDWLIHVFSDESEYFPKYASHVDAFITLGTPFWGSKLSEFVIHSSGHLGFSAPAEVQLEEMSFGSNSIYERRELALHADLLEKIRRQVRTLNIGGYVKWLRPIAGMAAGINKYEDDTAVIVPSSRFNFLYVRSYKENYFDEDLLSADHFSEVNFAPFVLVNAIHLSPSVELPQLTRGMAQIQSGCLIQLNCDHPTLKYIEGQLLGEKIGDTGVLIRQMTSFLIDINVSLPESLSEHTQDVTIKFAPSPGIRVGRKLELYSGGISNVVLSSHAIRFYFTGVIDQKKTPNHNLRFEISGPGYKTRIINAPVRPTYSTFVDVNLERDMSGQAAPDLIQPSF